MTIDAPHIIKAVQQGSPWTFFVVFWAAAALSMSSCTIVRVPVVIGFVGGFSTSKKRAFLLTLSFVAALVLSYTLLGVLFALITGVGHVMMRFSRYFYYLIGVIALLLGAQMAGLVNLGIYKRIASIMPGPKQKGMLGAFLFGLLFVLFEAPTCPVCGPFLFVMATLTLVKEKFLYSVLLFFFYALGQSLPILLIGTFTGLLKYEHKNIERVEKVAGLVGGNILIVLALYLFLLG